MSPPEKSDSTNRARSRRWFAVLVGVALSGLGWWLLDATNATPGALRSPPTAVPSEAVVLPGIVTTVGSAIRRALAPAPADDEAICAAAWQGQGLSARLAGGTLPRLAIGHAPQDGASWMGTLGFVGEVIGMQAVWTMPEVMVERSDTMLSRGVGMAIGQRAGWPAERVLALKQETADLHRAAGQMWLDPKGGPCGAVRQQLALFSRIGEVGEVAAARELVAKSSSKLRPDGGDAERPASYPDRGN